jgi:hypothetical protein
MPERKFCSSCGKPENVGARFCAYCGQAFAGSVSAFPPSQSPPSVNIANQPLPLPSSPSGENIIGVIPGASRKKGMFAIEAYHVVVTEKRLIFAIVTKEAIKEESQKSSGKGFGGFLKTALAGNDLTQRYLNLTPQQALRETPENFDIDINRIRKIKIEKGLENMDNRNDNDGKLILETVGDKLSFALRNHYVDTARELLRQAGLV